MFQYPVGQASGDGLTLTSRFNDEMTIDHIVLMENLELGQNVAEYGVEALVGKTWTEICRGETIGHKRIEPIAPVTASAVRLRISKTLTGSASIRLFAAYNAKAH